MPGQEHIILRKVVEVEFSTPSSEGYQLQQEVSLFANEILHQDLEQVFDSVSTPDVILHFDQITLTIHHEHQEINRQKLSAQITEQLKQKLLTSHASYMSPVDVEISDPFHRQVNRSESLLDHFFYFIVHGQLQWNATESIRHDFVNQLNEFLDGKQASNTQQKQFDFLMRQQAFRNRLIWQFNSGQLLKLIAYFKPTYYTAIEDHPNLKKWLLDDRESSALDKERFYSFALASHEVEFLEKIKNKPTEIKEVIPGIQKDLNEINEKENDKGNRDLDITENWFIENAGLVLLNPFLNTFFTALGIVQDGKMLDTDKGIAMMQYLAAFQQDPPEHVLVLNKVMCGLAVNEPVKKYVDINDAEKSEALKLLQALISHWQSLGNTSIENLQGSFFCRNGKLSLKTNGDWYLQVERKGWDILMDQIPWSYTIIAFPWMRGCMWVEW